MPETRRLTARQLREIVKNHQADGPIRSAARKLEAAAAALRAALAAPHRRGCRCRLCVEPQLPEAVAGLAWQCRAAVELLGSFGLALDAGPAGEAGQ